MLETPAPYFEDLWASSADPWDHAGRWYETRKYDLTVGALPSRRYRHALEPACGVGLVTVRLATRADVVSASDRFAGAVDATTARCAELSHVDVSLGDIREGPPRRVTPFDLVVLGEVLYYFDATTVVDVIRRWHGACEPGGHVALVHHRPAVAEHVLDGDAVHTVARDVLGPPVVEVVDALFRIDVFTAPEA